MNFRVAIGMLVCVLALPGTVSASVRVWDGGGSDANWMTPQNWVGDVAPVPNADSLEFPERAAQKTNVNNFPPGSYFLGIHFSGETGGYVLSGQDVQLGGSVTSSNISGSNTINVAIRTSTNAALIAGHDVPLTADVASFITGTVTNATTGAPIASLTVQVFSSTGGVPVASARTNAGGVYTTRSLPNGLYFVMARPVSFHGVVGQLYSDLPCFLGLCDVTTGTPVVVTGPTPNINFALPVGGTITGTVIDAKTSAPVQGARVDLYDTTGEWVGIANPDAQGFFTLAGLPTGSYFVTVLPEDWTGLAGQLYDGLPCPDDGCPVTVGTPVAVTAPNTTTVNFALSAAGTFAGVVTNATTGAPVSGAAVGIYSMTGELVTYAVTDAQGAYATLWSLRTGSYFLIAFPLITSGLVAELHSQVPCPNGVCTLTSGTPVAVTVPNTNTVNFALATGGTIRGTVTNAATDQAVPGVSISIFSRSGEFLTSTTTNAQGMYATTQGLPTGSYVVRAFPPMASDFVGQLYNNLPCPNLSCNLTGGTPVLVTAPQATPDINFALVEALAAPNDTFAAAPVIESLPFQSIVNIAGATQAFDDPVVPCGNGSRSNSVWYLFTPTQDGPVGINTIGSNYDTILAVYTGSPGSFSLVGCNDDALDYMSALTVQGIAGQRLAILVTRFSDILGDVLVLNVAAVPGPFAKVSPASFTTTQSTSVTLTWEASADAQTYDYCVDTIHNSVCNAVSMSVGNATSVLLTGLLPNTQYSWQVRALNIGATTYADGATSAFWTFTTGVPAPPFGQVDTPAQNAVGVQGAIGVTGWALDDEGVAKVEIFRNCLPFEAQNCQTVLGSNVVYVGEAVFLPGARPDVAAAFPAYPQNTRAGWGYLLLTPLLPHVPKGEPHGGEGALTLYVVATDTDGNQTLLGRSSDPASPNSTAPTAIAMTNDSIAQPFGTIDTPEQGATISGTFNNFGWVVTPDNNTTNGDPDDIVIPTNGSTMTVFIDGLPTAVVAYDQCRGTVGNPVPAGLYCDDDVANIFGNPTPLSALTTRTGNPTLFRNLDMGRGAIGAYTFDTTLLANGLHTIAWSVTDSLGRTEGIGSRFFVVSNDVAGVQAQPLGVAPTLKRASPVTEGVWVRMGFDLAAQWRLMSPGKDATFALSLQELGRMELWFGDAVVDGYLATDDRLLPLPIGASLKGSLFAWMPPPGYVGPYHLVFMRGEQRIDVTVTVVAKARGGVGHAR